jgi:hypothetical protein
MPDMSLQVEQTQPSEQSALVQFLISVFDANPDAPFVNPKLMWWKYFEPCADWSGPRSMILKQGEQIVAHGGIFPFTFVTEGREVAGIHLIDWAASPSVPGAGVLLLRKVVSLTEVVLAIGGSSDTREVMPKIGFKQRGDLQVYARVIRPWGQLRACGFKGWKAPLRLARNVLWSLAPTPSLLEGWSAVGIPQFDESVSPLLQARTTREFTPCKRSAGMLNYMLSCPGAVFSAFLLMKAKELRGYFILSSVGGQCRVADILINSNVPADWRTAFAVATRTAAENPETCEVEAVGSIPLVSDAISHNGFHLRERCPIFLFDPKGRLADAPPLHINLLDGEGAYLNDPAHPFLT